MQIKIKLGFNYYISVVLQWYKMKTKPYCNYMAHCTEIPAMEDYCRHRSYPVKLELYHVNPRTVLWRDWLSNLCYSKTLSGGKGGLGCDSVWLDLLISSQIFRYNGDWSQEMMAHKAGKHEVYWKRDWGRAEEKVLNNEIQRGWEGRQRRMCWQRRKGTVRTAAKQINYPQQTDTERQRGQCVRGRNDKIIISSTTSHGESTGRLNCNIRRCCDEERIKIYVYLMICCCVCLQRNFLLFDEWK